MKSISGLDIPVLSLVDDDLERQQHKTCTAIFNSGSCIGVACDNCMFYYEHFPQYRDMVEQS